MYFLKNKKEVLEAINSEERAKSLTSLGSSGKALLIEKPLGVEWCIESDAFQFKINLNNKPIIRRVSSFFYPVGLILHFILIGKRIS